MDLPLNCIVCYSEERYLLMLLDTVNFCILSLQYQVQWNSIQLYNQFYYYKALATWQLNANPSFLRYNLLDC